MRIILRTCIAFSMMVIGCENQPIQETRSGVQPSIDSLFEAYYQFKLRINPIEATKAGEDEYNAQLANYISGEYRGDLIDNYIRFLSDIARHLGTDLSESQKLNLEVMKWDCEIKKEGLENAMVTIPSPLFDLPSFQLMPISQISSLHLYFSQLASGISVQPFHTVVDYENWLLRVDAYLPWLETVISNMQKGIENRVVWPKVITERLIEQISAIINTEKIEDHVFYQPIKLMPEVFSQRDRARLEIDFRKMITEKLNPSYQNLLQFLINEYYSAGGEASGIGTLPQGKETYQYLIKYHTTTKMTPDEIFDLGKREVTRIEKEMEIVKKQVGYDDDLRSFFDYVRNNQELMPFHTPAEVIDNFNSIHQKMENNLAELFDLEPNAGFEVRRTESFREASASAEYVPGTKDGSRPGVFYVPIPDVKSYNTFADEALFLHEAVPGHHYQLSLQQENEKLPAFLHSEGMGVFVEGWALYCESLGKELGLYEDPFQYFGMLSMEMHRAIRLVVDVGLHAKGWTREQAIQYSLDHEADSEASIIASIERYMVCPGQALSYKIGQLKIRELRERAEKALGHSFSIKEFHNQVLNAGSLPLTLLEEKIDRWVEKAAP